MTLRQDEQQWLISEEDSVTSAVRALEILALLIAGPALAQHPLIEMRAMGNMMMRLGQLREEYMLGVGRGHPSEMDEVAGRHLAAILGELSAVARADTPRQELHAALFWLDSQLQQTGIRGASWMGELAKGMK